jgi:hypothetical protein
MDNEQQEFGFIHLFVLLIAATIVIVVIVAMAIKPKNAVNEIVNTPSPNVAKTTLTPTPTINSLSLDSAPIIGGEKDWVEHIDKEKGFSFKIPKGWEIVSGVSNDSVDFDLKSPDKTTLVGIGVFADKTIKDEADVRNAILEKENVIKSSENYKIANFQSSVKDGVGTYSAEGEQYYLNFANSNAWDESDLILYKYQEKGQFGVGKKTLILYGLTLPGSQKEETIKNIFDSFKFIQD